ncbi:hypothetical protein [Bacillus paralicheniformis]|uniref:hypothetical protein n=1 Tax=Bacillus paralicheniformis TaxID=1648923 RepID=UPI001FD640A4|nr:hypothetical protein [Bacillus paralicheniformis]MCJ8223659.1 hypothetical protein [Bacillus paralicheniformis]
MTLKQNLIWIKQQFYRKEDYKMAKKFNENGFRVYDEFKDVNGTQVRIEKSTLATEECVSIFGDTPLSDHHFPPHLNVETAKRVIKALQEFVEENS